MDPLTRAHPSLARIEAQPAAPSAPLPPQSLPMHPPDGPPYKQTRTFSAETLPAALRADHRTRAGVWGRVVVEAGAVELVFDGPPVRRVACHPGSPGHIPPQQPHRLVGEGPFRLFVEFRRED